MKKFILLLIALITTPIISFSQDNNDEVNSDYLKKRELNYDPNSLDFNRIDLIKTDRFWWNYLKSYSPHPEFKGAKGKLKKNINKIDLMYYPSRNSIDEAFEYDIENMSRKEFHEYLENENEKSTTIIELTVDELKELTQLSILRNKSCFNKKIDLQISSCVVYYYSGSEDYFDPFPGTNSKGHLDGSVPKSHLKRAGFKPIIHLIENAKPGDFLRFEDIKVNLYYEKQLKFKSSFNRKIVLKVV